MTLTLIKIFVLNLSKLHSLVGLDVVPEPERRNPIKTC